MEREQKTYSSAALGCLLGSANQALLSQLDKALKDAGLTITATEYLVLRALYCKDGIQQCEIAEMVGRDKAGICRCIAGLVKKGLLKIQPVSYKCLRVFLSDKAREIQPHIMRVAKLRHDALTSLVTPDELETFTKVLNLIVINKINF